MTDEKTTPPTGDEETTTEESADEKILNAREKELQLRESKLNEQETRIDGKLDKYGKLAKEIEQTGRGMIVPRQKEETPEEYAKKCMRGEISEKTN